MKPEIASLLDRLSKGGEWRAFRDEIAALHAQASTEAEYVTLLEAHSQLVAVGKETFDAPTYEKLKEIAGREYIMFLTREATEGESINPVRLERVTAREVAAGRLHAEDEFRTLAKAGAAVLGAPPSQAHLCKNGDWLFYGVLAATLLSTGLVNVSVSPLWLIVLGLAAGWFVNERERKAALLRATDRPAGVPRP